MLLHIGLSNAVLAGGLAIVATLVGAVWRRPAVVHGLWLLVLLKLVTPPFLSVPLPEWTTATPPTAIAEPVAVEADVWIVEAIEAVPAPAEIVALEPTPTVAVAPSWPWVLTAIWAAGSLAWLTLAVWRTWRFRVLLRYAEPAPDWLTAETEYLAARLGLSVCPPIALLPGRVSPMLWALGGPPQLYLPVELLDRLNADARAALLAHELAHLRRGDHRVRWLEFACTVLYWWHPILWWARRQLREAEEQCCDAWVVWALPTSRRAYALALADTVEFLSEAPTATPALASGIGPIDDLRKRVTMILKGDTPRDLSWIGGLAVLGLGAFLLPLTGSWAEEPTATAEVVVRQQRTEREPRPMEPKAREDLERANHELNEARQRVEELRARLREAEAELHRAQARLQAHEAGARGRGEPHDRKKLLIRTPDGKVKEIELPEGAILLTPEGPERRRIELELRTPERPGTPGRGPGTPAPGTNPRRPAEPATAPPQGGPGGPEGNIHHLERRLDQLMREMEEMRREMRRGPTGPPTPPAPPAPPR